MKIQRFEADTVEDALRQAQMALGPDALVLHTRQIETPGASSRVEVVAAVDHAAIAPPPAPAVQSFTPASPAGYGAPYAPAPAQSVPVSNHPGWEGEVAALRRELDALRTQLRPQPAPQAAAAPTVPATPIAAPAKPSLFTAAAPAPAPAPQADPATLALARRLRSDLTTRTITMRPGRCTTVALAGPTGVGKTTTLAKLAAAATHGERKRVAIINLDTYRIGAMEQLEAYARLLQTPLTVAYTAADVRAAREQYADYDLVLVDTTGRSPRNSAELDNLAALLDAARPEEVHLLLEMRDSPASHAAVLKAFRPLRPTHLLLTKLDEAVGLTESLEPILSASLPVSYVTTGQRVPEDLAPATSGVLLGELGRSH
jgi:flagellar biosynthesis protein FlhF